MSRPKGSKNKVKKDKPTKAAKRGRPAKAVVARGRPKGSGLKAAKPLKAESFKVQVQAVLSHILELFKASLIDAFRQYIEAKMWSSQPASIEEFTSKFKHTVAVHGVSEETLLNSLGEIELEYLSNGPVEKRTTAPVVAPTEQVNKVPKAKATKKGVPVEVVKEESSLKEACGKDDFFGEHLIPTESEVVKEENGKVSVFDSLDII